MKGQNGINSPYSRYGFGVLADRSMGFNKGMGGVAQGYRDGQSINIQNPASYSAVDSMTALFDIGMTLQNGNFKMANVQKNIRNTSLDYFAIHFRAAKNLGIAAGILPLSNTKYSFSSSSEKLEGTENVTSTYNYNGDGGLHEIFIGAAWRPFKPLSFGFNAGYIYGDYNHSFTMGFSENGVYSLGRKYTADISTYGLDFGIQYIQPVSKTDKFVIGASYTLGHDVKNNAYRHTQTINGAALQSVTIDTIRNAFQLPTAYSAGITYYHGDNLKIGVDATLQKWSDCKFPNNQTSISKEDMNPDATSQYYISTKGQLHDYKRLSIGAEWRPNALGNFFQRMTYKVGGFYSQSYAKADITNTITDKPKEFGLSAGVTIPFMNRWLWRNSPKINVAVQWTHSDIPYLNTTNMKQAKLTENYLRLCLGLTFSECWFYKWKVQ